MPPRKSKNVETQNLESIPEEEVKQQESTQSPPVNKRKTRKVSSKSTSTSTPTQDLKKETTKSVKVKPPHLVKGSEEARKRMSELRAMRKPKQPKN